MIRWIAALGLAATEGGASGQNVPVPMIVDCQVGPYIVFFRPGSASIDADGRRVLRWTLENIRNCGRAGIHLDGYADAGERHGLASARVATIRRFLLHHGVQRAQIRAGAGGPPKPPTNLAPKLHEFRNRRVNITVGELE